MPLNKEHYRAVLRHLQQIGWVTFGPRVMVLRDEAEGTTKGGLIVPDAAKKIQKRGTIVSLGQGYEEAGEKEYVRGAHIGMTVLFNSYDGIELTFPTDVGDIILTMLHVGNCYGGYVREDVNA